MTAIDIHPFRNDYIVLGFERGQMILFNAKQPASPVKVIRDHHKLVPIINIKFCDWQSFLVENED